MPRYHSGYHGTLCGFGQVAYLLQLPGIFFRIKASLLKGMGMTAVTFWQCLVPSCILGVVLRFSGSSSLSMFLSPFNSLININVLYQILFYLSQVDREVSVSWQGLVRNYLYQRKWKLKTKIDLHFFRSIFRTVLYSCYVALSFRQEVVHNKHSWNQFQLTKQIFFE